MDQSSKADLRLAIARVWHEANSFSPISSSLERFRMREWQAGPQAGAAFRGQATEMGAVVDFLDATPRWQGSFLRCTSSPPGGPVVQRDLEQIFDEILAGMAQNDWDGIYLSLHGALSATEDLCPELTFLRQLRAVVGTEVPIAASFDMHACLNPAIAQYVDIIVGYKKYPHTDMYATAAKALRLLHQTVSGQHRWQSCVASANILVPSHSMRTDGEPMGGLVRRAAAQEKEHALGDITVFGAFAYADTPWASASVSVCYDAREPTGKSQAQAVAHQFTKELKERHGEFMPRLPDADAGLARAQELLAAGSPWPVAVLENSDNPLSGGAGDTPGLFAALLRHAPEQPALFASFCDPDLVDRAHSAGVGAELELALGGRLSQQFGAPVAWRATVVRVTDGRFVNSGPMEHGRTENLGRTAVLQNGNISVVIAETSQSVNDPAWFALHGLDPSALALICAKAKNHFRASFKDLCAAIIDVDTPGPAPADLLSLKYRHVPVESLRPTK